MDIFSKELEAEMKKFIKNIRYLRNKRGYSQEKLAEMISIAPSIIAAIENGDKQPNSDIVNKIGKALGLPKYDTNTPESLLILSGIVESISQTMTDNLLTVLAGKEFSSLGRMSQDSELNTKFEISSYLVFIVDLFATKKQNEQSRQAIFEATTSEILQSLRAISGNYSEKNYNVKLYKRMDQYGELIGEPDSFFAIPRDFKISKSLWGNLTNTLAKRSLFKNRDKQIEILSLAYGIACQEFERNLRILLNEVFLDSDDIRNLTSNKLEQLLEKARKKISEIENKGASGI